MKKGLLKFSALLASRRIGGKIPLNNLGGWRNSPIISHHLQWKQLNPPLLTFVVVSAAAKCLFLIEFSLLRMAGFRSELHSEL